MSVDSLSIDEYRDLARVWLEYACNGTTGRTVDDPVYRWVTEGRDRGPGYSSCADLAHWLMKRLGIDAAWINRAEAHGWKPAVNVGRLCCAPVGGNPLAHTPEPDEVFSLGDVIIAWHRPDTRDAHVMCVGEHRPGEIDTYDYGQGPMGAASWSTRHDFIEARKKTRVVRATASGRWQFEGGKIVRSVLRLADVLAGAPCAAPDRPTGEFLESLGLPAEGVP